MLVSAAVPPSRVVMTLPEGQRLPWLALDLLAGRRRLRAGALPATLAASRGRAAGARRVRVGVGGRPGPAGRVSPWRTRRRWARDDPGRPARHRQRPGLLRARARRQRQHLVGRPDGEHAVHRGGAGLGHVPRLPARAARGRCANAPSGPRPSSCCAPSRPGPTSGPGSPGRCTTCSRTGSRWSRMHAGALEFRPGPRRRRGAPTARRDPGQRPPGPRRTCARCSACCATASDAATPARPAAADVADVPPAGRGLAVRPGSRSSSSDAVARRRAGRRSGRTVYRIVQEGLTNARKHAPGARCTCASTGGARGRASTSWCVNPLGRRPRPATPGAGARAGRPRRAGPAGRRHAAGTADAATGALRAARRGCRGAA